MREDIELTDLSKLHEKKAALENVIERNQKAQANVEEKKKSEQFWQDFIKQEVKRDWSQAPYGAFAFFQSLYRARKIDKNLEQFKEKNAEHEMKLATLEQHLSSMHKK